MNNNELVNHNYWGFPMETMTIYSEIASLFNTNEENIRKESFRMYLNDKVRKLTIEKFNIAKKYGISTIEEMEAYYKNRKISEKDSFEDYFTLSHVEEEISQVKKVLEKL
jgi:hypothetical protein